MRRRAARWLTSVERCRFRMTTPDAWTVEMSDVQKDVLSFSDTTRSSVVRVRLAVMQEQYYCAIFPMRAVVHPQACLRDARGQRPAAAVATPMTPDRPPPFRCLGSCTPSLPHGGFVQDDGFALGASAGVILSA